MGNMNDMSDPPRARSARALRRREDQRFLTGAGQYTDDVVAAGPDLRRLPALAACARAHPLDRHSTRPRRRPACVAIFTGADLADAKVGGLPCGWLINSKDGTPMKEPAHPVLAQGKVRHVGDQVALVVAETLLQAKDAAELIEVDYEELPAVVDIADAPTRPARRCTTTCPTTPATTGAIGDKAAVDAAFAKARARHASSSFVNNRLIPNAMEPRAANAAYNRSDDELHAVRRQPEPARRAAADVRLRARPARTQGARDRARRRRRLRLEDLPLRRGDVALVWASKQVGRPIKWTAERSEAFLTDAHGRDHVTTAELALDKRRASSSRCASRPIANMGAYLSTFASAVPTILYATLLAGQYKTPAIYCEVKAVFTNTAPVDAYRGAGRPEATYVVERIVETAAREMKIDPAEIRRRNFITDVPVRDAGRPDLRHRRLRGARSTRRSSWPTSPASPARKAASEAKGKKRGLGYSLLHRGLRHRAVEHRRRARRARRPVRGRRGARAPDRQGDGLHRLAQPRPGPRDDVRAGRRRPGSASRSTTSRSCTATPAGCRSAWAPTAAARSRSAARRSSRRSTRSSPRARRSPPTCWRRPTPTSSSRTASSRSPAPTRRCRSAACR